VKNKMLTGQRILFQPKNSAVIGYGRKIQNTGNANAGGGSGSTLKIRGEDGQAPIVINMDAGFGASDVPFVATFVQVAVVTNIMIIASVFVGGIYIVYKMKKSELYSELY